MPYPADAAIPPGPPSDPGPGDSAAMRAYQQQLQSLAHRQHAMMMPPLLSPAPTASGVSSTRASISGTMEELSVAARAAAAEDAREAGQVRRAAKRPRYAVPVDRQADRLADRETLTSEGMSMLLTVHRTHI